MSDEAFDTGRYIYCVVKSPDTEPDEDPDLPTGVDDEPVSLVGTADLLAVVHECEALYDTADTDLAKTWVLQHQAVIDAAGERFGTPLPFQFDTILTGTDERVREWLEEEAATLNGHLDSLAGHWEYRIEVRQNDESLTDRLEGDDDRLQDLATRIDDASEGTGHLLEKQYERRLDELRNEHRNERARAIGERLDPLTRTVRELPPQRRTTLDDGGDEHDGERTTQVRFAVLAPESKTDDIGAVLDDVAAEAGVEVRFTGPWPPYTFAPTLDDA